MVEPENDQTGETHSIPHVPTEEEQRQMLQERRESKELSPYNFYLNRLYLIAREGRPLRLSDIQSPRGPEVVVMTYEEMMQIGTWSFISRTGERIVMMTDEFPEDSTMVLWPELLGETEGQPRLEVLGDADASVQEKKAQARVSMADRLKRAKEKMEK